VNALYKEVEKADVAPTLAQARAFTKAENDVKTAVALWEV
jgi:hypothetical protein